MKSFLSLLALQTQDLSLQGAQAIASYLNANLKKGILVMAAGKSSTMPVSSAKDEDHFS